MERHWFSHSKTSVPNKLCLSRLCSIRCTRALSQPSTADALSLRPHSHTTNNLCSRTPSIAAMFSCQGSRPPPDHRGNTFSCTGAGVSSSLGVKISACAFLSTLRSCRSDCHQGGGATGCHPLSLGTIIHYHKGVEMSTSFFAIFSIFSDGDRGLLTVIQGSQTPPISHFNGPTSAFHSDLG